MIYLFNQTEELIDVIDEASMTELYELPVHIGNIGTRTVCVGEDIA